MYRYGMSIRKDHANKIGPKHGLLRHKSTILVQVFGRMLATGAVWSCLSIVLLTYNDRPLHKLTKDWVMAEDMKMDYVEFPADDLDAVEAFYAAVFGWKFQDFGENYRAFSDGKLDGGFYRSNSQSRTSSGAALMVFYAEDLEAVQQAVVSNGGLIAKQMFSFPGGRRFHFLDPNGNELAVWSDN